MHQQGLELIQRYNYWPSTKWMVVGFVITKTKPQMWEALEYKAVEYLKHVELTICYVLLDVLQPV